MSANLETKLREALLNNSYDHSSMKTALRSSWENSYSYLYNLQKNLIEYEELFYYSGDEISRNSALLGKMYVNPSQKACFDIGYDFIHVCNREEFYHSEFYNKPFTIEDMVSNPQIFTKIPIIIIDDKTIWDYKLKALNGKFVVTLPFGRPFVIELNRNPNTDDIIYIDHKVQVLVVDNVYYERIRLNRVNAQFTRMDNSIAIDTSFLSDSPHNRKTGKYFLSVHVPNYFGGKPIAGTYELGSMFYPCEFDEFGKLRCRMNEEDTEAIYHSSAEFFVSIIFINHLHLHTFYTGDIETVCEDGECNIFVLQNGERNPYAMPIPVEDLIVFKTFVDTRKTVLMKNTDMVEMYYPNFYHIKDADRVDGDIYKIYYFYHPAVSLRYTTMFDYFDEFLSIRFADYSFEETIDKLYRGDADTSSFTEEELSEFEETFTKLFNYQYFKHNYGDIDFIKRYRLMAGNEDKDPFEYEDETLRSWIANNPTILRNYVLEQDKLYVPIYHMWTKTIDLSKRYRTSTVPEQGAYGSDLDEECYVFAFRNDNTTNGSLLNARIFVDGIFVVNMHQIRHYYTDYFYIPVNLVTDDSYIEIEIFPTYTMHSEIINFKSLDDEKIISLAQPENKIFPTAQDLYCIAPSGYIYSSITGNPDPSEGVEEAISITYKDKTYRQTPIYDNSSFTITAIYDDTHQYEIKTTDEDKPVKFTRLSTFKIRPNKDLYPATECALNTDIIVCISKTAHGMEYRIKNSGYAYIPLVESRFKFNKDYIRIFRNGRLVPREKYIFYSSYSIPRIVFTDWLEEDEIIYIDITPYRYKEIYHLDELTEGQTLIDLKDVITKPFDIRYYDVYMNGRKLGLNNVFTISPWEITLVNLHSYHHLQIFEKERDYEYFGTNYKEASYYYTIDDLFNSTFIKEEEKNEIIKRMIDAQKHPSLTIKPNEDVEEVLDFEDLRRFVVTHAFYFFELVPRTYVNPDRKQYSESITQDEYPEIYENYFVKPVDSSRNDSERERRKKYIKALNLNPDLYIEGGINKGKIQYVYSVGLLDDVDEECLSQTTTLSNDENITS